MKIKNYEGAAGCFAEACKLWRANPVAHCDLATAYLHLGRSVLAARALILFFIDIRLQIRRRGSVGVDGTRAGPEARRSPLRARHGTQGTRKCARSDCR